MASKKNFDKINTGRMYDAIADATAPAAPVAQEVQEKQRRTYNETEAEQFMSGMQTSGRKGLHLPRINMAFTPEVYDYIKTMAKVSGITMTDFINTILAQYMEEHHDVYDRAIEFRKTL